MLNKIICLAGGANTGFGDCTLDPKNVVAIFIVPIGATVLEADLTDFGAYLQTKINEADASQRWYPVNDFVAITDNSEDPTIESFGYGGKAVSREGEYDWTLRFVDGGLCLLKSLRKFNNTKKAIFFVDADGVLFGTTVGETMQSIPLTMYYASPWKVNDGSASTVYNIRLSFKAKPANDDVAFVDLSAMGLVMSSFKGLQNLSLVVLDPAGAPITNVRVLSGCDRKNLFEEFSVLLADPALWKATDVDGLVLTVSAVTANSTLQAFAVTVSSAAKSYFVELVDPEALDTAGVSGYESIRTKVTIA